MVATNAIQPLFEGERESLSRKAYRAIQDAIISKAIAPGATVTEAALATQLGISKTPVREALLRLRGDGLIEVDSARRMRITAPSKEKTSAAYELRWVLEQATASFAALRATDSQRKEIEHLAEESVRAAEQGPAEVFRQLDAKFHTAIAHAAMSPQLAKETISVLTLTAILRARDWPTRSDSVTCALEHNAVAEAISVGDADKAGQLSKQHVLTVYQGVLNESELTM